MRGGDDRSGELFSYVDLEARVRPDHPLRSIRSIVNEALVALERDFSALYSAVGRPSIPPEKLLRAMLLQAFYSIRSERQLMERLEYDLSCSAGSSGSASTMRCGTTPPSRRTATVCLMENRAGLLVDACLTPADGHAERVAALHMIEPHADRPRPITLGDRGFDSADFVNELRSMNITPHVAQNTRNLRSAGRCDRLCRQPAHPKPHRGGVRLDQDHRRPAQDQVPRRRPRRLPPSPSPQPHATSSDCRTSLRGRVTTTETHLNQHNSSRKADRRERIDLPHLSANPTEKCRPQTVLQQPARANARLPQPHRSRVTCLGMEASLCVGCESPVKNAVAGLFDDGR